MNTRLWCGLCAWVTLVSANTLLERAEDKSISLLPESGNYGSAVASIPLIDSYTFADSWGKPATADYVPPSSSFNRVILDFTVNTTGNNYDRLVVIKLDDIEIWRSSTPEPDDKGVTWTARKDLSYYLPLFQSSHKLQVYLNNVVQGGLEGTFIVSLSADFYNSNGEMDADDGWAVSLSNLPSQVQALSPANNAMAWSAPGDDISIPVAALSPNVGRAMLHIFASGNGDDEFWWDSTGSTPPSRFVDVYVGGKLAGFTTPFPVIFTGGLSPYLWKPLVGLRAFDVPAYFVDITPFLPALWSGTSISFNVTNGIDGDSIPSNWFLNANLLTWTEGSSNSGTSDTPVFTSQGPSSFSPGDQLSISRQLKTSADLMINGKQQHVEWIQNAGYQHNTGGSGSVNQFTWGNDSIVGEGTSQVYRTYSYPLQTVLQDNQYFHVQASYDVNTGDDFTSWINTQVGFNKGSFSWSNSSEYSAGPYHTHYAESVNQVIVNEW